MILPALALAVSLLAGLTAPDRAALSHLRSAVDGLEHGTRAEAEFQRLAPPGNIRTWQRLQRQVHYPKAGSLDLAFALAYYHVDYHQNLQRLLLPAREPRGSRRANPASLEILPLDLTILQARHHDVETLNALLDPRLHSFYQSYRGDPDPQCEALNNLWSSDPVPLLRAASGSRQRLRTLAEAVDYVYGDKDPAHRVDATMLRRLSGQRDRRVALAARQLLIALQAMHKGVWPPRGVEPYQP
jgi:hypothetical protein